MTALRPALAAATERLTAAGVDSPEHDARALAVHVLRLEKPSDLLMVDTLDDDAATAFQELVSRRAERVPLQHLVGTVGFRYIELEVGPGTSWARANAMVPEPVHRSTTTGCGLPVAASASTAHCTTDSVSGRGTKVPGPTSSSM